jgi:hypothetical protein
MIDDNRGVNMLTLISLLYSSDGNCSHGLLVDELAEARLALDDAVGDVAPAERRQSLQQQPSIDRKRHDTPRVTRQLRLLLAAESGKPYNELNGINIVGDDNLKDD